MYMFHVQKITDNDVLKLSGMHTRDFPKDYSVMSKESFDDDPDRFSDLIPMITQIKAKTTMFNHVAMLKHYGFPPDAEPIGEAYGYDHYMWMFPDGKSIELNQQQYESYLYETEADVYVYKCRQVAYWRKHHKLDDFLQDSRIEARMNEMFENKQIPTQDDMQNWITENCGYYVLSQEEKQKLREFIEQDEQDENCRYGDYSSDWNDLLTGDQVLMYHAWW